MAAFSGCVPDGRGGVWVHGATQATDLATADAFLTKAMHEGKLTGGEEDYMHGDGFVLRLDRHGRLLFLSYLGTGSIPMRAG